MALKKDGISEFLLDALLKLQNEKNLDSYNLAGGTALTLQIGHRVSTDIDLFTVKDIDREFILDFLKNEVSPNVKIINNGKNIFQVFVDDALKIDFVKFPYKFIEPLIHDEGVRMAAKSDIAAMKMSAVGTRGYEARDFVDLFFLLKEMSIKDIVDNFKKLYQTEDIAHYKRSMAFFDDVSDASWKSLKMIRGPVDPVIVKKRLTDEVADYDRTAFLSISNTKKFKL